MVEAECAGFCLWIPDSAQLVTRLFAGEPFAQTCDLGSDGLLFAVEREGVEKKDDPVLKLRSEFIELRKSGKNRDDSWYIVLEKGKDLSKEQINQLLLLSKGWEIREGHRYRSKDDTLATFVATR